MSWLKGDSVLPILSHLPFISALRRLETPIMSLGAPRFNELHVTATFNSGNANAQLNDLDEGADE
jgi:hypothetical protein